MTVPTPEQSQGHPAWQEILDAIPDPALQELIRPKLEDWDKGVQQKLQDVRQPYEPYSKLVENEIPAEAVEQALYLRHLLETNPQEVVAKAIEAYGLEYVPKSEIPSNVENDEDEDYSDMPDITQHPAFQEMLAKVNEANEILTSQQQTQQEQAQQQEMEQYLESLHQGENGERIHFSDLYVATLIANGVDGEEAVNMYKQEIAEGIKASGLVPNPQQDNTPIVMGGNGTTGSGLPENPVQMGSLKKGDLNDLVMDFLNQNNKT